MEKAGFLLIWGALAVSAYGEEITCMNGICTAQPTAAPTAAGSLLLATKDTVPGDYVVAGVGVRTKGTGNINVTGIPAGAQIVRATLYWATLGNGQSIKFKGQAINGTPLGTTRSPCWPQPSITTYRANVAPYLTAGGNGTYAVILPDSKNPKVAPSSEGASVVIVYRKTGLPNKTILVYDGAFTYPYSGGFSLQVSGFQAAAKNVQAKMTQIVADGQGAYDPLFIGGKNFGKPFVGKLGWLWDSPTFNISPVVPPRSTQLNTNLSSGIDCLTWSAVAFSVNTQ